MKMICHQNVKCHLCLNTGSLSEMAGFNQCFKDSNRWGHIKSSIDSEDLLVSRPHCGSGLISFRAEYITCTLMTIDSDRITGVQLRSVSGVHLPFCDGRMEETELYSETRDGACEDRWRYGCPTP